MFVPLGLLAIYYPLLARWWRGGGQNTHNFREKNQFSWADQRKRKRGFIVLLTKLVVALHDERILFSDVSKFLPTEFKTNVVLSWPNGVRLGLGLAPEKN